MFIEINDLITGQYYYINQHSICYFTKEENFVGCKIYYIVLNDGTKISINHKKWNKIRNQLNK